MRVKVVVHVDASSGMSRVELMGLSRLAAEGGEGDSREGYANGLSDRSHGVERCWKERKDADGWKERECNEWRCLRGRCWIKDEERRERRWTNESAVTEMTCQKNRAKRDGSSVQERKVK